MWLINLLVFLFGLLIGSFLNVVIYRYNTGFSISCGRSMCFQCGRTLHWYELVPLLSFIIQARRCRQCGSKIAWQYPAVELLTGILFVAVWYSVLGIWYLVLLHWLLFSTLVVILVYDLRHKIIPDGPVYLFIGLSFLVAVLFPDPYALIPRLLTGLALFLIFAALWYFSAGRWMGFGDAKLVAGVGLLLGLEQGIVAMVLAFWSGALVGVGLILVGKLLRSSGLKLTIKSEIPFAPFIIFGLAVAFFLGPNFFLLTYLFS